MKRHPAPFRPFILRVYGLCMMLLSPFLRIYLYIRCIKGKEDPRRVFEKWGDFSHAASVPAEPLQGAVKRGWIQRLQRLLGHGCAPTKMAHQNTEGAFDVVWLHGVSVGESISLIPLAKAILNAYSGVHVLITSSTVTSSRLVEQEIKNFPQCYRMHHAFLPLDVPRWVTRFLKTWQPCVALFTEGDIWPNLLYACKKHNISTFLINGNLTQKSAQNWQHLPKTARYVLSCFDQILAQSEAAAKRYTRLLTMHQSAVSVMPNLKFSAAPLTYNQVEYERISQSIDNRPVIAALSTHEGEENIIVKHFLDVQRTHPQTLLILAPRHPHRTAEVIALLKAHSLSFCQRSHGTGSLEHCDVYLVDTMGDMGLVCALSSIAIVGGSLVDGIGGHNPIEPGQMHCCVLWGPFMHKTQNICAILESSAVPVTPDSLASTIIALLNTPERISSKAKAIKTVIEQQKGHLHSLLDLIAPHIQEKRQTHHTSSSAHLKKLP